jgi:hypothetical protein
MEIEKLIHQSVIEAIGRRPWHELLDHKPDFLDIDHPQGRNGPTGNSPEPFRQDDSFTPKPATLRSRVPLHHDPLIITPEELVSSSLTAAQPPDQAEWFSCLMGEQCSRGFGTDRQCLTHHPSLAPAA